MDAILIRTPKHVLHGRLGLTWMYGAKAIATLRDSYSWLIDATRAHIREGYSSTEIVRLNLVPPALHEDPEAFIGYLTARKNLIARVSDHMVGIW